MTGELLGSEGHAEPATVGPYVLHRQIARGGMATIHLARLIGGEGFSRIVAAKRLLPQFAADDEFVAMFLDEARIASKVHHHNVVPVLDVVRDGNEVILVQEYVHGVPLNDLLRATERAHTHVPIDIAVSIAAQILAGLQGAHDTVGTRGQRLEIVHRDVSPGNVIISVDGTARLLDFGVAKATMAAHITSTGAFKGKRSYAAPESLQGAATHQSDIYSLSVVLWEMLVVRRLHPKGQPVDEMMSSILHEAQPTITEALADLRDQIDDDRWFELEALEPIVSKGLAKNAADRWKTAAEMAEALTMTMRPASSAVAAWVRTIGSEFLDKRDQVLASEAAEWRNSEFALPGLDTQVRDTTPASLVEPKTWHNRTIVVLCALIVVLAIGVVFAISTSGSSEPDPPPQPAATATPPQPTAPFVTPGPLPAGPTSSSPKPPTTNEPPHAAITAPFATEPPSTASISKPPTTTPPAASISRPPTTTPPTASISKPIQPTPSISKPPAARASISSAQKPPTVVVHKKPPPAPLAKQHVQPVKPKPVQETAKPAVSCNPPYYFVGKKKVFKPACL